MLSGSQRAKAENCLSFATGVPSEQLASKLLATNTDREVKHAAYRLLFVAGRSRDYGRPQPHRAWPGLDALNGPAALQTLQPAIDHAELEPVHGTITRVRQDLPPAAAILGFCGAPWTFATYMIAGQPDQSPVSEVRCPI
jgi:hypothetical protein